MFKRDTTIRLKFSRAAVALEILGWLLIAAVVIYSVQLYEGLGETIATGFNEAGEAVEWNIRQAALIHPILAVFFYIVLTGVGVILRRAVSPDGDYPVLRRVLLAVSGGKCVYLTYELFAVHYVMNQFPLPAVLKPIFFVLLAAVVALTVLSCLSCRKKAAETA